MLNNLFSNDFFLFVLLPTFIVGVFWVAYLLIRMDDILTGETQE